MPDNRDAFKFESVGALTVGAGKDRWKAPFNGEVIGAQAVVGTAPTGAALILDVLKNGVSIYTTNAKPTIAAGATDTTALATPDVGATKFSSGDDLTLSVTQVGSTVAGSDLDVTVEFVAR